MAYWLHYIEGKSYREIAEEMGYSDKSESKHAQLTWDMPGEHSTRLTR